MRATLITGAILVLLLGACSFSPDLPSGRVLCTRTADCPGGQTCEKVEDPAAGGAMVCCQKKGCGAALDSEQASRVGRIWSMLDDAGAAPKPDTGEEETGGAGAGTGGAGTGGTGGSAGGTGGATGSTGGTGGGTGGSSGGAPDAGMDAAPDGARPPDASPDRAADKPPLPPDSSPPADTGPSTRPNGAACTGAGQCTSNRCVDGVCCDSSCSGRCQACDVAGKVGTCSPVAGAPHGSRQACGGQGSCAGRCDGVDTANCAFPGMATECAPPRCQGDSEVVASTCNGSGSCVTPAGLSCGGMGCVNNACVGGVPLGTVQGNFGGGQFTTSTTAPSSVIFSYGYECPGTPTYIFDGLVVPEAGLTANLAPGDDPQFATVTTAFKNGPAAGCGMFRAGTGFRPNPPFNTRGSFFDAPRLTVPAGAQINFLRLEIPGFTISSSPSGSETLWEIPLTPFKITAYGR